MIARITPLRISPFAVLLAAVGLIARVAAIGPIFAEVPGQIKVDSAQKSWLVRSDGSPYFMCGPGDPEGFLYRDDQNALIDKLARTGANSIYLIAVRSHGGDGGGSENPFTGNDPNNGLDRSKLNQWEHWFARMDSAGITIFFLFYDDGACPWRGGCKGAVSSGERAFIEGLVDKFEHHKNLIWVIAEEYQEALSKSHASEVAKIIRKADDHDHPIASHQLSGISFDHADDPNIDQFAIQYNGGDPDSMHRDMVAAWNKARGRYNLNMSEVAYGGVGTGEEARRRVWAMAMGGAYVMVNGWNIDDTPEARLRECGYLVKLFERAKLSTLSPRDELSAGSTEYVLANPGRSYIAYSSDAEGDMGVRGLTPGAYRLLWLDTISGATKAETVTVSGDEMAWPIPSGFSKEVALSIEQGGGSSNAEVNTGTGNAGRSTNASGGSTVNTSGM